MIFNKCKQKKKCNYEWSMGCTNCKPGPFKEWYDKVLVKIPYGISIESFCKDIDRECPNCGLQNTLFLVQKTNTQNGSTKT